MDVSKLRFSTGVVGSLVVFLGALFWSYTAQNANIASAVASVDRQVAKLEGRLEGIDKRLDSLNAQVNELGVKVESNSDAGDPDLRPQPVALWPPKHSERMRSFCSKVCGKNTKECFDECHKSFNYCGTVCVSDPRSQCFNDCRDKFRDELRAKYPVDAGAD